MKNTRNNFASTPRDHKNCTQRVWPCCKDNHSNGLVLQRFCTCFVCCNDRAANVSNHPCAVHGEHAQFPLSRRLRIGSCVWCCVESHLHCSSDAERGNTRHPFQRGKNRMGWHHHKMHRVRANTKSSKLLEHFLPAEHLTRSSSARGCLLLAHGEDKSLTNSTGDWTHNQELATNTWSLRVISGTITPASL